MLRRVKKDVENELSDKIEILVYCPLTRRQKLLYQNLRKKISIDDLMQSSSTASSHSQSATSSLMNLVMQFRKVCNHPDLFEKREVKSPFFFKSILHVLPKLFYREGLLYLNNYKKQHLSHKMFSIFHPDHIHYSLFPKSADDKFNINDCCFSFLRFIGLSTGEISQIFLCGLLSRWIAICLMWKSAYRILHNSAWKESSSSKYLDQSALVLSPLIPEFSLQNSDSAFSLVFTSHVNNVYGFTDHHIYPLKTVYKKENSISSNLLPIKQENVNGGDSASFSPCIRQCQLTSPPSFLTNLSTKVIAEPLSLYVSDRSGDWWISRVKNCGSIQALRTILYGSPEMTSARLKQSLFHPQPVGGISAVRPPNGWSKIVIPDKETIVTDSGKLQVLDNLLTRLKAGGHRVLIYSQMTRMIDLLEDYMYFRKHTYMRLDGSSKIADRRDMVADFQNRKDIVNRTDEADIRAIDSGLKNPWRWDWLEKSVNGVYVREVIRKLRSCGVAYCLVCSKELIYGSRGFSALAKHMESRKHADAVEARQKNVPLPGAGGYNSDISYGLHPMFKGCLTASENSFSQQLVPLADRIANSEAMLLGFLAEKSLSFSLAPDLLVLVKELSKDRKALNGIRMHRTSAAYKLRFGVARTFEQNLVKDLKREKFSLNIDESMSNNNEKIVTVLVNYLRNDKIVTEHLQSFSVPSVNSTLLFQGIVKLLEENNIPWHNLMSVLLDSCHVMRGKKSGLESRLREKCPHLLDIDGDSCHHAHNAAKLFCKPFGLHLESLFTDIHNDFKWSPDLRAALMEICEVLNIKYTMPQNYISFRWLSVYVVAQDFSRMISALTLFYFSFLSRSEKTNFLPVVINIYKLHNVTEAGKEFIHKMHSRLAEKNMTQAGKVGLLKSCLKTA
ncbi:DNA helicase INO80 [Araneus ventricosus]|uniref:Chromatin-remodeling ATPase INO80 n=1 Tax=Araneus ventricosus TaxID=182803 RepID=A0A4Y2VQ98_ARAVE|nr:DNA helicase INO80 [Araneus ventricosus]